MEPKEHGPNNERRIASAVEALAREDAERAAADRVVAVRRGTRQQVALAVSLVVLAAAAAWGANKWRHPVASIPHEVVAEGQRFELGLAARAIEAYRQQTGALPKTLEEVYPDSGHIRYRASGDAYTVEADGPRGLITLDAGAAPGSGEPPPAPSPLAPK
jgi:hypothetical protein